MVQLVTVPVLRLIAISNFGILVRSLSRCRSPTGEPSLPAVALTDILLAVVMNVHRFVGWYVPLTPSVFDDGRGRRSKERQGNRGKDNSVLHLTFQYEVQVA